MKDFIKNRLRLVLETVITEAEFSTHADVNNVKNIINQLQKEYGNDEYFLDMSPTGGQGTVDIYVDKHGLVKTQRSDKTARVNRRATDFSREDPKSLRFMGIPVGRGIEHPDTYSNKTRQALTIGGIKVDQDGSPASDAAIKAYLAYPEEIISLVNRNREDYNAYVDDAKGAAAQVATKGDEKTQINKNAKLDRFNSLEKNKKEIVSDPYEYYEDEVANERNNSTDRHVRKNLRSVLDGISRIQRLYQTHNKSKEEIYHEIDNVLKMPSLYNKNIRGMNDPEGNNILDR